MSPDIAAIWSTFAAGVLLTLVVGFYSLLTTKNLVRALISLEVLTKGVTLLILLVGYVSSQVGLAQALAITLIVIEVAVIVVAISVVVCIHKATGTVSTSAVAEIKG